MQTELEAAAPGEIAILGVNEAGQEASNDLMIAGRTLPWLQDTPLVNVWTLLWQVEYRDVRILDREGKVRAVYNLTAHDLSEPANFATLKQLMLDAR